ncbi:MAG: DUF268 domain-containing protein [Bacteroidota bacterium]|nr:DUF268 domain-containing protein [Bacteroidota bacterium]
MNVKKTKFRISVYYFFTTLQEYFSFKIFRFIKNYLDFRKDYSVFVKQVKNIGAHFSIGPMYPCLNDKTDHTPMDYIYFYQDAWACRKVFELKPAHHYDIGSSVKTIGILAQFVPVTMIDIRKVEHNLPDLNFQEGTILALPFKDNSVESISSLCVIEHIGLGRYGDAIDTNGSEKAIAELVRVTKQGGYILFSVPVEDKNSVYFNAQRTFSREFILAQFSKCEIVEEKYIYNKRINANYLPGVIFEVGLFLFRKK